MTGPEKMLGSSCFIESRNDKWPESFMSQPPLSFAVFSSVFFLITYEGTQGETVELSGAAAMLLSKPHPYFSQKIFHSIVVTFHDQGLRPFMKETVNINGKL